ncbi:MAG: radical SAM family heme chaperone HemW [Sphingobacteriaceae bacterium]
MAGIYIHIPFCKQACTYCDFHFSVNTRAKSDLIDAICIEAERSKDYLNTTSIETIYFGGGTPSILNEEELGKLLNHLSKFYSWSDQAEITIECNPDDLNEDKLHELKKLGFNRLSIGLQSFNDAELKWMNRAHTSIDSIDSVKRAQDAGFNNITIDLIYGSKFSDLNSWDKTLQTAIELNVQHISAYNLTIEKKTKLGVSYQKGVEPAVNDDLSAEQFKLMISKLESNGFIQYEISNFGKENYFSKHNSNYWLGATYLGLGPSAHSFNGNSRQWNVSSNSAYINALNKEETYFEKETLSLEERFNEYILTRLRTIWGCSRKDIEQQFGSQYLTAFDKVLSKYQLYFYVVDDVVTLNLEGKLRADFLASEFFI